MGTIITGALAGVLTLAAALSAADPGAAASNGSSAAQRLMERLDTNHDGVVSMDEYVAGQEKLLAATDANKDGTVSADELTARLLPRQRAGVVRIIRARDTNRDGKISLDEAKAYAVKQVERQFRAQDRDGDGFLTETELMQGRRQRAERAAAATIARYDTNKDGKISKEEAQAQARATFARLDTNGDGKLDAKEIQNRSRRSNASGRPPGNR